MTLHRLTKPEELQERVEPMTQAQWFEQFQNAPSTRAARREERAIQYEREAEARSAKMQGAGLLDYAWGFSPLSERGRALANSVLVGGVADALQSTGEKVAAVGGAMAGQQEKQIQLESGASKEAAGKAGEAAAGMVQEELTPALPMIPRVTETVGEDIARSMVSFFTLYGPVFKGLQAAGFAGKAITSGDALTTAAKIQGHFRNAWAQMPADIGAGLVGDIFAFENKEGTFADFARALGMENQLTQFLSGQQSDSEWEASLKAGLEGAGLGVLFNLLGPVYHSLKLGIEDSLVRTAGRQTQAGMVVFHASPHQFSKFDMSKIGTGEGAQAFGYGLYFAENPKIAGSYFDDFSRGKMQPEGSASFYEVDIPDEVTDRVMHRDKPIAEQEIVIQKLEGEPLDLLQPWLRADAKSSTGEEIYDALTTMINYYRNIVYNQSEFKEASSKIARAFNADPNEIFQRMSNRERADITASSLLDSLGIPGLKYSDASSRGRRGGSTSNLVMFSDRDIKIKSRSSKKNMGSK